jgi:hypothetical protein
MTESITCFGLVHSEVARVDVRRKDRNVALGEIGTKLRRLLEVGEAEERRNLSTSCGAVH